MIFDLGFQFSIKIDKCKVLLRYLCCILQGWNSWEWLTEWPESKTHNPSICYVFWVFDSGKWHGFQRNKITTNEKLMSKYGKGDCADSLNNRRKLSNYVSFQIFHWSENPMREVWPTSNSFIWLTYVRHRCRSNIPLWGLPLVWQWATNLKPNK